jgi:hypothetical protein
MDILYLSIVAGFFLLTWGLAHVCDRLGEEQGGHKQ